MSSDGSEDYSKMKVIELKKLLKEKGLPLSGTKDELIDRLKQAEAEKHIDETDGNAAVDEDLEREIMAEGDKVVSSTRGGRGTANRGGTPMAGDKRKLENGSVGGAGKGPVGRAKAAAAAGGGAGGDSGKTPPKVVKLSDGKGVAAAKTGATPTAVTPTPGSNETPESKLEARAKKFGISSANEDTKKELRAKRFGTDTPTNDENKPLTEQEEAMKKRAERFGIDTATPKIAVDEKKKKRAERFGIAGLTESADTPKKTCTPIVFDANKKLSMASPILSQTAQERKAARADRFK